MTMLTRFSFHPIGQGIFSSGGLSDDHPIEVQFRWVYDCGTVKRWQRQLGQEIQRYASFAGSSPTGRPVLDLVFVSHFDLDHVSGLVELLSTFDVDALVLPYLPLWQRVASAVLSARFDNPDAQAFFTNPVAFIASVEGARVRRIILVPPSDGQAGFGDDGDGQPQGGDSPNEPPSIRLTRARKATPDDIPYEEASSLGNGRAGQQVMWLEPGGRILAPGGWEFVPYNDPKPAMRATPGFRLAVRRHAKELLDGPPAQRSAALGKLKEIYKKTFGATPKNKNEISLFVYGGPTFSSQWHASVADYVSLAAGGAHGPCESGQCAMCNGMPAGTSSKAAILYTGDGYLSTDDQFHSLYRYLGPTRLSKVGTLQVMHHGSKHNWRRGLAARIAPLQSVFCADKSYSHHHPHDEVWNDFEAFGATKVDARRGHTRFQVLDGFPLSW